MRRTVLLLGLVALVACGDDAGTFDGGGGDAGPSPCLADPFAPGCMPDPDPTCADDPCPAGERCVDGPAGYACECPAGFERRDGACVELAVCEPLTCDGHGTCSDEGGGVACVCEAGYAGPRCGECDAAAGYLRNAEGDCVTDLCDPSPCSEPERLRCEVEGDVARCLCNAGTHDEGGVCVPDVTCTESTCSGRGTCVETGTGVACTCAEGSVGAFCESCDALGGWHEDGAGGCTTDACLPNPCAAPLETVCTAVDGDAVCSCDAGAHREAAGCVPDEVCGADTCAPGGTCVVDLGRTSCQCASGYDGPRCEACAGGFHDDGAGGCTDDACLPNPCSDPNETICTDDAGTAVCSCDPGYHPDGLGGCTDDPCTPDPCVASGQACRVTGGAAECYTPVCDDGNPCTDDTFDGSGCVYDPRADGSGCSTTLCTGGQSCAGGVCGGGTAVSCDDGNPCTRDSCDAVAGCANEADDGLVPDDGVGCTADTCSGGTASNAPDDGRCDDGLFCNGAETCSVAADCVDGSPPIPPGPSTPCRSYGACDEATDGFPLTELPTGASCDDGLSCTSGDLCRADGVCVGTALATCPAAGSCAATSPLEASIDIPVARAVGAITVGGAAPPAIVPYGQSGFALYLLHRETGQRHYVGGASYGYRSSTEYELVAGSDGIDVSVLPGVYDVIYERGHDDGSASQWPWVRRVAGDALFPNGYAVLREDVVLGAGTQTLDVDVPVGRVSGAITVGGAAPPAIVPYGQSGFTLYLVHRETGQRHYVGGASYGYRSSTEYELVAGSDALDVALVPGVYDLIYERGHDDGSDSQWPWVRRVAGGALFPNGYASLGEVVLGAGAQTVDVDVPVARVSGAITVGGAAPPAIVPYGQSGFALYLVHRETEQRHYVGGASYGYRSSTEYELVAGSDALDVALVPGVYDLVYERGHDDGSASQWPWVRRVAGDALFPNGYASLGEVVLGAGAQTVDVEVPVARVSGAITVAGAAPPAIVPYGQSGFALYLVHQQTQQRHYVGGASYGYRSSTEYELVAGSEALDVALVPGSYDVIYERGHDDGSASQWPWVRRVAGDALFPNGYAKLGEVVLAAGTPTVNVDVPVARVSGAITVGGVAPPAIVPYGQSGFALYLVHRDTGQRHYVGGASYGYRSSTEYELVAGSDALDVALVPGVYDLVYERGHDDGSASQWPWVRRVRNDALFPNGYATLGEVVLGAGAPTVNVDVPVARLDVPLSLEGLPLPTIVPYGQSGFALYLVHRETGQRHYVGGASYGYRSSTEYELVADSDRLDAALTTGTYDLVYERGHDDGSASQWPWVRRVASDALFPNAYADVLTCVAIE